MVRNSDGFGFTKFHLCKHYPLFLSRSVLTFKVSWSDLTPAGFLSVRTIRSDSCVLELGSMWRAWQSRSCMNRAICVRVGSRGGSVAKQSRSCVSRTPIILMWVQLFSPMFLFFYQAGRVMSGKEVSSITTSTHPSTLLVSGSHHFS